jgi:hypothetical protein
MRRAIKMDPSVIRAMARWPNVPAVYGWLSLDRRGRWCLRGEPVTHRGAIEFMNRNYACTDSGQWYFQNGPQRVFADLDYTPWIFTLAASHELTDHTGRQVGELRGAWLDEDGNLLLLSERGVGLLCDRDLGRISDDFCIAGDGLCDDESIARLIEGGAAAQVERIFLKWSDERIELKTMQRDEVAGQFGFEPQPRAGDDDA